MTIKFNNQLDEPASEKQMQFIASLLEENKRSLANRKPNEKGQAFINALVIKSALTKWEASSLITVLKSNNLMSWFNIEHNRKIAGKKLTSTDYGAALRSAFPEAYKLMFGDSK